MTVSNDTERVLAAIEREGMLFVQDARLPSVSTLVAGEPVKGSWWGHPAGKRVFAVIERVEDAPDVARFKLLDGKVCLVHRRLWSALACVGRSREEWQTDGLSKFAAALLARLEGGEVVQESGPHVKQLETRLLCVGDQKHVESGNHATELRSWKTFAKAHDVSLRRRSVPKAKAEIEEIVDRWKAEHRRRPKLPWG